MRTQMSRLGWGSFFALIQHGCLITNPPVFPDTCMEGEWVVGHCLCEVCASRRFCRFRDQNNQVQYSYDSN